MPFPPRFLAKGYTKVNILGTIPYFIDGEVKMAESCGVPMYLVEKYGPSSLRIASDEPDFAAYLNWITHADATLTCPQTVFLRSKLKPQPGYEKIEGLEVAGEAYAKWFIHRLRLLDQTL